MFLLESPHRGDSDEYTQYTIFSIEKKITLNYPKSADMGFFQRTRERVRNSRGKRAISVRATEVSLYSEGMHIHNFSPLLQRETIFITPCLSHLTKKPLQKRSIQKRKKLFRIE